MVTKVCIKCRERKELTEFPPRKRYPDGRTNTCRVCTLEYGRIYNKYHKNPQRNREKSARWAKKNPEKVKEYQKNWRENNIEYMRVKQREWKKKNIEKCRIDLLTWRHSHPDNVRQDNMKSRNTESKKLNVNISKAISQTLKNGKLGQHWEDLVGYTVVQLKKHLERQFTDGMSWDNYGKGGWEVDHRIPKVAFNFETPFDLDFRQCWALRNLQPLWISENRSKGSSLKELFQPSLLIRQTLVVPAAKKPVKPAKKTK